MSQQEFERARSADAKQQRQDAILTSAARLAIERGIRAVTLTDVAAGVGMHKSTMLRYFETREEIFLRLAQSEWAEWAEALTARLRALSARSSRRPERAAAERIAATLVERPLFCDLLAQTPLNLERGVSMDVVKDFKLTALESAATVAAALQDSLAIDRKAATNIVATATSMAGALWQTAAVGTEVRRLYETDPELAHAVVDVEPRLVDILFALITGYRRQRAATRTS